MLAPEYYEYVRMRDIYQRDQQVVTSMADHAKVLRRSLTQVVHTEDTIKALYALDAAIARLEELSNTFLSRGVQCSIDADRVANEVPA